MSNLIKANGRVLSLTSCYGGVGAGRKLQLSVMHSGGYGRQGIVLSEHDVTVLQGILSDWVLGKAEEEVE